MEYNGTTIEQHHKHENKFQVFIHGGGYVVGYSRIPTRQPALHKVMAASVFKDVEDAKQWVDEFNRRR